MSTNKYVNGSDICLFITGGTGTTLQVLALADDCKISMTTSTIKVSSKDSGNFESALVGRISWTVDSSGFYSVAGDADRITYEELLKLYLASSPIFISIGGTTGALPQVKGTTGKFLTGYAIITKLDADFKDQSAATFSISMEGNGALQYS